MNINTTTITITFGDQADNNIGMQKYEKCKHVSAGLSIEDLKIAENKFKQSGCECNYVDLAQMLPGEIKIHDKIYDIPNAAILIIRNGINKILEEKENGVNKYTHEDLFNEHIALDYDKKAHMYGRIVNKTARWNLSFDDEDREPDYENKMGRIVAYKNVALTSKIRDELPNWFGDKAIGLVAEANLYYDVVSPHKGGDRGKSYIGYHGDTERNITIGISFLYKNV